MGNLDEIIENREDVKPGGYEPLPAGMYKAAVTQEELVPNSKGTGMILKTTFSIFDDVYGGREIRYNFNVKNDSEKAQQIGRSQLASLGIACGLGGIPSNSSDLREKVHTIKVAIVEGGGINPTTGEPYGPKNEIKGWYAIGATPKVTTKAVTKAVTKATGTVATDDNIPW